MLKNFSMLINGNCFFPLSFRLTNGFIGTLYFRIVEETCIGNESESKGKQKFTSILFRYDNNQLCFNYHQGSCQLAFILGCLLHTGTKLSL